MNRGIIDCEVHILHPDACTPNFLQGSSDPVRKAIHDHTDYSKVKDKLSLKALMSSMDKNNITTSIIMGMPWKDPAVLADNNQFVEACAREHPSRFRAMYIPHLSNPDKAAQKIMSLDSSIFLGVKMLPRDQGSFVDDEKLAPIFEAVQKRNMFFMVHTNHVIQSSDTDSPFRLLNFLRKYPNIKTLAPHLGGLLCLYALRPAIREAIKNVHFIASVSATMKFVKFAAEINPDNLIFGSDFPFNHCHDHETQLKEIQSLGLSNETQEKILWKTAQNLFKLNP